MKNHNKSTICYCFYGAWGAGAPTAMGQCRRCAAWGGGAARTAMGHCRRHGALGRLQGVAVKLSDYKEQSEIGVQKPCWSSFGPAGALPVPCRCPAGALPVPCRNPATEVPVPCSFAQFLKKTIAGALMGALPGALPVPCRCPAGALLEIILESCHCPCNDVFMITYIAYYIDRL